MEHDKPGLGADDVRRQLRRILDSADFEASPRNRRFLSYVVEETLGGRADRIKAYTIATRVFDRGPDFDPQLDSIVRIEAGRLRRALDHYYLKAGTADPIRLSIPKGSYFPSFEHAGARLATGDDAIDASASKPRLDHRRGRAIFVAPFEEEGDQSNFPNFTRGFTRQIIIGLTRFTSLFVFGPSTTFGSGTEADRARFIEDLGADFLLTGGTALSETRFNAEVLLVEARTGRYLWGETFERNLHPNDIVQLRDEVAVSVVRTLAQPYGILFSRARENEGAQPESLTSYDCVVRFHLYWRTYDHDLFEPVRAALEQVIETDPGFAEAFACLSQMYTNAARFRHDVSRVTAEPMQRAMDLARRAIELAPASSRGHHALGLACWFSGEVGDSLDALQTGLGLNPNDSEIMADLGLRYAMLMDWHEAVPLLEESYARNPAQPGPYRIGLALYHYAHGRYRAALTESRKIDAAHVVYGHLLQAVAAARLGLWKDAEAAARQVLAIDPEYFEHIVEDLQSRNLDPELILAIIDGLRDLRHLSSELTSAGGDLAGLPGSAKMRQGA